MLHVLITLAMAAAFIWFVSRQLRALLKVRSGRDLATFLNARNNTLQSGLTIAEVGAKRAARDSFEGTIHRATPGVRFLATVLAPLLFYVGNSMLIDSSGTDIPAELAPWLGLALLVVVIWYLVFIWTYSIELTRDTVRVPSLLFYRRSYLLDEIERVDDTGGYYIKVRFRSGRRAELLKYVMGREALLEGLERRTKRTVEDACQSSPKSKPFGAVSFR